MNRKILIVLIFTVLFGFSISSVYAQNDSRLAELDRIEKEIDTKQQMNPDEMPALVRKAHIQNLIRKYNESLAILDALVKASDVTEENKRVYRAKAKQNKEFVSILSENLGVSVVSPPAGDDPPADAPQTGNGGTQKPEVKPPGKSVGETKPVKTPETGTGGATGGDTAKPTKAPPQISSSKNEFENAIKPLVDRAQRLAADAIADSNRGEFDPQRVGGDYNDMLNLVIPQSILGDQDVDLVSLEPFRYLPETARTDKQIGSSASTTASTSAIDKPGFASFLGFAIENGFVEQNVQDTVLTLSTSPIALFSLTEKDSVKAYNNYPFFNKIGLSASFNINNENPLLANATRSQLREYSVRYRLFGDRSSRAPALQEIWDNEIAPKIRKLLLAEGELRANIQDVDYLRKLQLDTRKNFVDEFTVKLNDSTFKTLSAEDQKKELTNFILNFIKSRVYDQIRANPGEIPAEKVSIFRQSIKDLLEVQKKTVFEDVQEKLDKFFREPLGTFAYINHRDPLGNYSQFKFLAELNNGFFAPLKLTFNAGLSMYHKPNLMMNQKRIRDFDFALSFEGKKKVSYTESGDLSPITYSFTGRYQRLLENQTLAGRKADILKAQFLMNFPIFRGFSLPVSVTYSNATETERKQGVRVNFGIKLDTDKLFTMNNVKKLIP
ncbi:MAG: hypothetical protein LUM44_14070 [Pyrinomonadaceae bacterium]|nr:hypothetical protein [Pyrinomonadaceae bacterium]